MVSRTQEAKVAAERFSCQEPASASAQAYIKGFEWEHLRCYFGDGFREMENGKLLRLWTPARPILVMASTGMVD